MIRRLIILLLIVGCEEPSQHGCLDSQACNYDSSATIDNNSCAYESDCAGVCGGNASYDICGVCGGDGYPDGACDCEGNVEDECGVCGGNNSPNTGNCDCEGTPSGNMVEDAYGGCCSSISTDFCDCNSEYVSLWGECYSIETTSSLSATDNSQKGNYSQIKHLINLNDLAITGNAFSDEIEPEIGSLTNLTYLNLSNFVGTIPPEICNLVNLTYLSMSGNYTDYVNGHINYVNALTEEIPECICQLLPMDYFWLNNNGLCPPYPSCIDVESSMPQQNATECEYCIANPTDPLCDE